MNKFAVAAVVAVAVLCIGSLAVCANTGHAVAVKPKKPLTPYQVCKAKREAFAKAHAGWAPSHWAFVEYVLMNHNKQPVSIDTNGKRRPEWGYGQQIVTPAVYARMIKTCW